MSFLKQDLNGSYSDPEFEDYYENLVRKLSSRVEVQGKLDGKNNEPSTVKHYWIKLLTPIKNEIQNGLDFNYSKFQPVSNVAEIQSLRTRADDKIDDLTKEKNDKEKKKALLISEQEQLKKKTRKVSKLRWIIPGLFALSEGSLVINMSWATRLPFLFSLFLGLLAFLVSYFGVILSANFICKAKTILQRKIRFAFVLGAAFIFSLVLGIWRANTYSTVSSLDSKIALNGAAQNNTHYSPWPFVVLSFISFLVAIALEIRLWITDEERKNLKLYEEKCAEVAKAQQECDALQDKIDSINAEVDAQSALAMKKYEYALGNERRLVSLAYHVVSIYESINIDYRKDKQCPAFFGQKTEFGFRLYFQQMFNSKQSKNEKDNGVYSSFPNELMSE